MQIIPLQAIPNQTLQVTLNNQAVDLSIFQYAYGLFMTVYLGPELLVASAICQNRNRIIRNQYFGFSGDFCFFDTEGDSDPVYTGFGSTTARYQLVYLDPADLPSAE